MRVPGYQIGGLHRREFRRACMELDLKFEEEKGFLDSYFVVEGEISQIKKLHLWLDHCTRKINEPV